MFRVEALETRNKKLETLLPMSSASPGPAPLVEVRRGGRVECIHHGHVAICDTAGRVVEALGDPKLATYFRSSAKPLQALAVLALGAAEQFGFTDDELAVICASHGAQPPHLAAVRSILEKCGLTPDHLQCGPHDPLHEPAALELHRQGRRPERIHNNCSGKHAGMLAVCRSQGWPTESYLERNHPLQRWNADTVAAFTGLSASDLPVAIDGCGVPTFYTPMAAMATAFARLANPGTRPAGFEAHADRILGAMCKNPAHVAHEGQFDTVLLQHLGEQVVCKRGAEGVFCAGLRKRGLGLAIKISDGSARPVPAIVFRLLEEILPGIDLAALRRQALPPLRNTCGEEVGTLAVTL
jgi:L-asparaginase II